jgi:hypothetical protein
MRTFGLVITIGVVALLSIPYTAFVFKAGQYSEREFRERWHNVVGTLLEWRRVERRHTPESVVARGLLRDLRILVDQQENRLNRELRKLID